MNPPLKKSKMKGKPPRTKNGNSPLKKSKMKGKPKRK